MADTYFYALGRRKSATARVRLYTKKGNFIVNQKEMVDYFDGSNAIRLGLAKALVELNEDYRATLRRAELLGRDPREKERKKFGLRGARKKRQFTKR
jgi:small subunit ribosomal protein S9